MNKLGVAMATLGGILLAIDTVFYVSAMPIFSLTRTETHTITLPVQKYDTIMNYSLLLGYPNPVTEVTIQMNPNDTLSFIVKSNMENTTQSSRTFDFSIVAHQPNGTDTVYYSQRDINNANGSWSPQTSGTYCLQFSSGWARTDYGGGMDINAQVIKKYTLVDTRTDTTTVTEVKPLIELSSDFKYVFLGAAMLGVILLSSGLIYNHRQRTRTDVKDRKESEVSA